MNRKRS